MHFSYSRLFIAPLYTQTHMLALVENIYNQLGFEERDEDDRFTILLRNAVLTWACNFGNTDCISKSIDYFAAWRANSSNP